MLSMEGLGEGCAGADFSRVRWLCTLKAALKPPSPALPPPSPPCSFCRDGLLLLHREAQYAPGGLRHASTPLALLWKDAACSRYLLDTDAAGAALAAQAVVLEYRMDRSVATADEVPVVLGCMPEAFVAQLGCVCGVGGWWWVSGCVGWGAEGRGHEEATLGLFPRRVACCAAPSSSCPVAAAPPLPLTLLLRLLLPRTFGGGRRRCRCRGKLRAGKLLRFTIGPGGLAFQDSQPVSLF